eukprot:1184277-Prorocentrum_minimum.AAC.2
MAAAAATRPTEHFYSKNILWGVGCTLAVIGTGGPVKCNITIRIYNRSEGSVLTLRSAALRSRRGGRNPRGPRDSGAEGAGSSERHQSQGLAKGRAAQGAGGANGGDAARPAAARTVADLRGAGGMAPQAAPAQPLRRRHEHRRVRADDEPRIITTITTIKITMCCKHAEL